MSLSRVILVSLQTVCNHLACTPPNPTQKKQRFHTEELFILQIAPLIFRIHQLVLWACTAFEVIFYLNSSLPSPVSTSAICLSSKSNIRSTPIFVIGVVAVLLATYIRLDCYTALGELFTFDLTVHPEHKLVTQRFYQYVRHPAYTGSLLLIAGLVLSHLTAGSWLTECGPLNASGSAIVFGIVWWGWTFAVGVSRSGAEDEQMKKLFGAEWEAYSERVTWWYLPGLI